MSGKFFKTPKRIGQSRGTRANLRNKRVNSRQQKANRGTRRREFTKQEKAYNRLSNISWTLFKIAVNYRPVTVDDHDIGNYEYKFEDCEGMADRVSRLTSNPVEVKRILNEELEMYRTQTGKYAAPVPLSDIVQESFKYGNAVTNRKYGSSSMGMGVTNCSFLAFTVVAMISLGRANAEWYSLRVPFEERNIANNIARVSSTVGTVCWAAGWIAGPFLPYTAACATIAGGVTAACGGVDMTVRFVDHAVGEHPLTPAQIASVGVSSSLSLLQGIPAVAAAATGNLGLPTLNALKGALDGTQLLPHQVAEGMAALGQSVPVVANPIANAASGLGYAAAVGAPAVATVAALKGNVAGAAELAKNNIGARVNAPGKLVRNIFNIDKTNMSNREKMGAAATSFHRAVGTAVYGPAVQASGREANAHPVETAARGIEVVKPFL